MTSTLDYGGRLEREMKFASESAKRTVNNTMRHQFRVLTDLEKKAMQAVKDAGLVFSEVATKYVHSKRELSLAQTKIEEAVMWAVKGITK